MSVQSYVLPVRPAQAKNQQPLAVRERITRSLLRVVAGRVPVEIVLPDGSLLHPSPTRTSSGGSATRARLPRLVLIDPNALYRRMAREPKIGLGESYAAGEWAAADGTDLAEALAPFAERFSDMLPNWVQRLRRVVDRPIPVDQRGAQEHTQDNIAAHYDLSNAMFASFLDPTLTYSSALFDSETPLAEQGLSQAQLRKIHAALDMAGVTAGTNVLEIGTGWGTLAIEAARRGANVTTVTLSVEQADLARNRIAAAGLNDRVDVLVQDYREITGRFEAVVSIEMIEAVGEQYWAEFFATLADLVEPGGNIAIQSILMSHDRYLTTRNSYGWIQKHIFPGGLIPSIEAIEQHATAAGLQLTAQHAFGADYAETLRRWRENFLESWPTIRSASFDDEFRRTWEFYLAYCEAGFGTGYLDVAQLRLELSR